MIRSHYRLGDLVADEAKRGGSREHLLEAGISGPDVDALCLLAGFGEGSHLASTVARRDPLVLADTFRGAFFSFFDQLSRAGSVVLVVEDLHLADPPSVRLLGAARREFSSRPVLMLATARADHAEGVLGLLDDDDVTVVELKPLRASAALELARFLLPGAEASALERLVERANGNPLRLGELARLGGDAAASGGSALAAVEARLARLDPEVGRVLRAASVFGVRFPRSGVAALVGGSVRQDEVARTLEVAAKERFVVADAAHDPEPYAFGHGLLQEAAYASLPDEERRAAHRAVAAWIASRGGADPSLVAWHYDRAAERAHAIRWFEAAARAALAGRELDRAVALADRILASEPGRGDRASALVLRAEAAFQLGDGALGRESARAALDAADAGSVAWVDAAGLLITVTGQRGENAELAELAERLRAQACEPKALPGRAIGLCRAATQLISFVPRPTLQVFLEEAERSHGGDPQARAWIARVESGLAALDHDYERAASKLRSAVRLHLEAGDVRAACFSHLMFASLHVFQIDFDVAARELEVAEGMARRTGAAYVLRWAGYARGKILALSGEPAAAREHLERVRAQLAGNPRLIAGTHVYLALAALRAKDGAWAEQEARAALAAHGAPAVRAAALAALARALVLQGNSADASAAAGEAWSLLEAAGTFEEHESVVRLALAEARLARGDAQGGREAVRDAHAWLQRVASRFTRPAPREAYLHGVETHATIVRLAQQLAVT
jgi:hypothetical protein